jgi:ribosome-associated protein
MEDSDNTFSPRPSKSQRKREVLALQKIGEALVELADVQLAQIPLEPILLEAIQAARELKSHGAIRRQLQYIGRLMCEIEIQPIQDALEKLKQKDQHTTAHFHQVERWRDQLITQGDEKLQEFIQKFADADRQHLRQLIRRAQQDRASDKNSGAETELFRYLRQLIHV